MTITIERVRVVVGGGVFENRIATVVFPFEIYNMGGGPRAAGLTPNRLPRTALSHRRSVVLRLSTKLASVKYNTFCTFLKFRDGDHISVSRQAYYSWKRT